MSDIIAKSRYDKPKKYADVYFKAVFKQKAGENFRSDFTNWTAAIENPKFCGLENNCIRNQPQLIKFEFQCDSKTEKDAK